MTNPVTSLGDPYRPIAIDANLLLRTVARSLVVVLSTSARRDIVIPETALRYGARQYGKVSKGTVRRRTADEDRERVRQGHAPTPGDRLREVCRQRARTLRQTFQAWVEQEARGNDRLWRIQPSTEKTGDVAFDLDYEDIVRDARDSRMGTGEDAQTTAEALAAGAVRIASDNLAIVNTRALDAWIQARPEQFPHARTPFVVDLDEAAGALFNEGLDYRNARHTKFARIAAVSAITLAQDEAGHEEKIAGLHSVIEILEAGNLKEFSDKARDELAQMESACKSDARAMRTQIDGLCKGLGYASERIMRSETRRFEAEWADHRRHRLTPQEPG